MIILGFWVAFWLITSYVIGGFIESFSEDDGLDCGYKE